MSVVEASVAPVASDATPCPLCAGHAAPAPTAAVDHRGDLIPWAIVLTSAVVLASVGIGAARWLGLGTAAGLLAGGVCAWLTLRAAATRREGVHREALTALADDGDARVETVIRQFEWAVNDVVTLKVSLERAEAAADALVERARQRERYVEKLEAELFRTRERLATMVVRAEDGELLSSAEIEPSPEVVPFRWALHHDGYRSNLELECGISAHRPTRVRIVDAAGDVVLVSGTPMRHDDGSVGFTLGQPPADLLVDLDARREPRFHLEALVDHEWKHVALEDTGRRTKVVYDKQGRLYRVADSPDAAQLLAPTL